MRISEDLIQRIKEGNNIVFIISQFVSLKQSGKNYHGLCPFHNEKTPSFSVSEDKQIYKCFGCGESGNVITFLMKHKGLSFIDSVKELGKNIGIDIENENTEKNKKKDIIYKLNKDAARLFYSNLNKNKHVADYLLNRGLDEHVLKSFGIGYSLDSWNYVLNSLKKSYSVEDIFESGLIVKSKNGNYYDRFRNRVIFPVFDVKGNVIGFGGRVLDDSKPKYLNSPETIVFHKGYNLYGLNFAVKNSHGEKLPYIIIVEGYMDVISLHKNNIKYVVASLGTALTENQGKLLKRYTDKVILSYDSDNAGKLATERGIKILENCELDVKILTVPKGKDPDDYINNYGADSFMKLVDNSISYIDYKLNAIKTGYNFSDKNDAIKYIRKISNILIELDPLEKDIYIKKISAETTIDEHIIYNFLNNLLKKEVSEENMNNIDDSGQKLYINAIKTQSAKEKAERLLLRIMMDGEKYFEHVKNAINEEFLSSFAHKKIYNLIVNGFSHDTKNIQNYVEIHCDSLELSKAYVEIINEEYLEGIKKEEMINVCVKKITNYNLEKRIKELQNILKSLESSSGNESNVMDILTELEEIRLQLARI